MTQFFTEIPVSNCVSVKDFVGLVVEWISGVSKSSVFSTARKAEAPDFDDEFVFVTGEKGEKFELRRLPRDDGTFAVGFRYELPDDNGLLWRTEAVLNSGREDAFLTVRVTCLSNMDGAPVLSPKRPYFLKLVLKSGWGASDGEIQVSDSPRYLDESEVELANRCVSGVSSVLLPVIYVSASNNDHVIIEPSKLAYDLGGIAHVVVEPSREFSFELRNVCGGLNPYGGALGVSLPDRPNVVRFVPTDEHHKMDAERLNARLTEFVSSRVTRFGLDWYLLQEESARTLRQKLSDQVRVSENKLLDELSDVFRSELAAKEDEITQLKNRISALQARSVSNISNSVNLVDTVVLEERIPQIYKGEVSDRIAKLLEYAKNNPAGLFEDRDMHIFASLSAMLPKSVEGIALKQQLKAAGSDYKKAPMRIGQFLEDLGFTKSDEGKHSKYIPPSNIRGLGQVTMAKTPSDHRSGKNNVSIVTKALGMTNLV